MEGDQDLSAALEITPLFYEAALEPAKWISVLKILGERFSASVSNLNFASFFFEDEPPTLYYAQFWPQEKRIMDLYLGFSNHIDGDPRFYPGRKNPNRPLRRSQLVDDKTWYASPIYREVFEPAGVDDSIAALIVDEKTNLGLSLGFVRPEGSFFTDEDDRHFQLYIPHLRGAMRLATRTFVEKRSQTELTTILDEIALASLLVDRFGAIRYANGSGQEMVAGLDALVQRNGRLHASDRDANIALKQAIIEATTHGKRGHISIPRADGRTGVLASVVPATNFDGEIQISSQLSQTMAIVFVNDPEKSYETSSAVLQRLFGLTETEAEIAERFSSGLTARDIAKSTNRSYETVRWYIKQLMAKTDVKRQADLMRLLVDARPPLRENHKE